MSGTGERLFGINTIYSVNDQPPSPYMTRVWIGRLRLHIFHRGDLDADCHDHPWDFWTFPLTSYVEEVVHPVDPDFAYSEQSSFRIRRELVRAFQLHFRPATHCHRVIGRWNGAWVLNWKSDNVDFTDPDTNDRRVITVVWRGKASRKWGFLKNRDGRWCWIHWKEYVFGGGKVAPCAPPTPSETKDLPQ
ncbi:hypothetical protein [Agrobacterium rosae]|uniref:hypothetical protein n=1 Tax=Agrobacterium rosae TaxID=1972867 RepID=UPI00122FB02F|nr:hypothetical protein [Agrobacterium rosae]KAA3510128.1 hypothetical protein DXM21_20070 [Agrobacterium rosae]KAA3514927.1 hypothetical protein DXM25_20300 [Agrobacterium rosae]MQB50749.1 hypothetical protein [Agrobacterium rosae]